MSGTSNSTKAALVVAPMERTYSELIEMSIYLICFSIGGPLNLIAFYKSLRCYLCNGAVKMNRLFLLRLNLNVADLFTMFIYTLTQIIWFSTIQWYGGDFLCRFCKFFYTFNFYLNSFIVVSIALDRLYTTHYLNQFKAEPAMRNVKCMITVAWVLAFLLSVPQAIIFRVYSVEKSQLLNVEEEFSQCVPIWTVYRFHVDRMWRNETEYNIEVYKKAKMLVRMEKVYNFAHLIVIFWIPTVLIVVSYILILCRLHKYGGNCAGFFSNASETRRPSQVTNDISHTPVFDSKQVATVHYGINNNENKCYIKGGDLYTELVQRSALRQEKDPSTSVNIFGESKNSKVVLKLAKPSPSLRSKKELLTVGGLNVSRNASFEHHDGECESALNASTGDHFPKFSRLSANTMNRAKRKTMRKAAMILCAYLAFWAPYNILATYNAVSDQRKELTTITLPFLNSLIVVTAIANPIIYGIFDQYG